MTWRSAALVHGGMLERPRSSSKSSARERDTVASWRQPAVVSPRSRAPRKYATPSEPCQYSIKTQLDIAGSVAQCGIERIAQGVAQQVEGDDRDQDRQRRVDERVRCRGDVLARGADHRPP